MTIELDECPCTGKNMSNLAAPWALLTLYHRQGIHGYKLHRPSYFGPDTVASPLTAASRLNPRWEQTGNRT